MLETKLHTYTKVVEDEEYSIIRKNIQDKICNDDVAILANTHKPIFLPLMEDREMALKMWHPGSRNTCVISKDSLILALAARSPSPCSADSKINHFFPLAQWMRIGGLGGGLGLCPLGLCPLVLSSFSLHNLLVLLY